MSDQSISRIKQQLRLLYPQLFDDESALPKLDTFITQAGIYLKSIKDNVSTHEYQLLIELYAAHLLYQSEDNNVSSFHVADVSYTASNKNSNGTDDSDPYLAKYMSLLSSLGFQDWSIQLG